MCDHDFPNLSQEPDPTLLDCLRTQLETTLALARVAEREILLGNLKRASTTVREARVGTESILQYANEARRRGLPLNDFESRIEETNDALESVQRRCQEIGIIPDTTDAAR